MGYAIFKVNQLDEIALDNPKVQAQLFDYGGLSRMVSLHLFSPFEDPAQALENINSISEGIVHPFLKSALKTAFPSPGKITLGVLDEKLGSAIKEALKIQCEISATFNELFRSIRANFHKFLKEIPQEEVGKAQLGLGHSYSRAQVKFSAHRADINIINAIALLDQLDKDINTFAMRVREWYGYHFPELYKVEPETEKYSLLVSLIKNKNNATQKLLPKIEEIVGDPDKAAQVVQVASTSMGYDISELDMLNIQVFSSHVAALAKYRRNLFGFLQEKMQTVAPNLTELIGEQVGARLISKAGSLVSLAKVPASTVQILGAEKALFRALKNKSANTPKYGLIYSSGFISRAGAKNKGRISRFLANKASIATRIDAFSEGEPNSAFGSALKDQVFQRLRFFETGEKPEKNLEVMKRVIRDMHTGTSSMAKRSASSSEPEPALKKEKREKKAKKDKKEQMPTKNEEKTPKKTKKEKKEKTPTKKDEKSSKQTPSKEQSDDMVVEEKTPKKKEEKPSKKDKKERRLSNPEKPAPAAVQLPPVPQSEKKPKKDKKSKKSK